MNLPQSLSAARQNPLAVTRAPLEETISSGENEKLIAYN